MLPSTGMPLGLTADCRIGTCDPILPDRGQVVLITTDGFQEAISANELFGKERMWECVKENQRRSAAEIIDALYTAAIGFAEDGFQRDDMTAIVVKCHFD